MPSTAGHNKSKKSCMTGMGLRAPTEFQFTCSSYDGGVSTTSRWTRSVYERAAKPLAVRQAASPDGRSSGHVLRRTKPGRHGTAWWSDGRARRRRRRAGGHCQGEKWGGHRARTELSRNGRRKRSASGDTPSDRPTAVITATSERTREREREQSHYHRRQLHTLGRRNDTVGARHEELF